MTDDYEVNVLAEDGVGPAYIRNIKDLRVHLQAAIELEHATIPPYLCGLYTIRSGKNAEAVEIIRTVVVQEMLHMVLVANVINAVGGLPSIAFREFVPRYPAQLPIGKGPFTVDLRKFSPAAIDTFLAIEAPIAPPLFHTKFKAIPPVRVPAGQLRKMILAGELYGSIAEFYQAIEDGLNAFEQQAQSQNQTIFTGDRARQVGPEHYYDAGGRIRVVQDLASALQALKIIVDQGEGRPGTTTDFDLSLGTPSNEVAHYYRFQQIQLGQMYEPDDEPGHPSGRTFGVDYGDDAVFDMVDNPRIGMFGDSDVADAARAYARSYTRLLDQLQQAFNGKPNELGDAIVQMFTLKQATLDLLNNPAPNHPPHRAGPCFEFVR